MSAASPLNPNLSDEQKKILFEKATEAPFSGKYLQHRETGIYTCVNCGAELFSSEAKYDSDIPGLAGWPSFAEIAGSDAVVLQDDNSLGMHRIEVLCKKCGGHLGHLFDDGSSPTGKHYCINSCVLDFKQNAS